MPRLLLCTLCDDVRFEMSHKHTLVGLFDTFNVADFAQPLPTFRVFARIGLDAPGTHPLMLRITSTEGPFKLEIAGTLDARSPSEVSGLFEAVFTAAIGAFRIPGPGRYEVRIEVDQADIGGTSFLAVAMTRPTLQ
ncbi:MAG TPA: hypothetical protein VGR62_22960 [Candidatus Binatia bacterium]|jgi:hypothetical protein|nr:hypothetical protein [Candidatus Binatia bacterium]